MSPETVMVAITRKDGGVSIMQFVTKSYLGEEIEFSHKATDKNINTEIVRSGIDAKSWRIITPEEVPTDRTFRDAWTDKNGLKVDMPKARDLHMERIRKERNAKLREADAEFSRAQGRPDGAADAARIEGERQKLRDLPATFKLDGASSPEQLKVMWPEELK